MDIRPVEFCPFEIFGSNRHVFVRSRVGERMISACVVPTGKHGGGVMVCRCFAGDTVSDLFRIQGTLNQDGYHSVLQRYTISSSLRLVGLSFVFNRTMPQNTSPGCVRAIWPRSRMMSAASDDLASTIEMVWGELDRRVKEKQPTSAQHTWELLRDSWKSIPH